MACCPNGAVQQGMSPCGGGLEDFLRVISQLQINGCLPDFLCAYPHYSPAVEIALAVLQQRARASRPPNNVLASRGFGGSRCPQMSVACPSPALPLPLSMPTAHSVRHFVNLIACLLEDQCPLRTDPNILACEDRCLAALQIAVSECLKIVRHKNKNCGKFLPQPAQNLSICGKPQQQSPPSTCCQQRQTPPPPQPCCQHQQAPPPQQCCQQQQAPPPQQCCQQQQAPPPPQQQEQSTPRCKRQHPPTVGGPDNLMNRCLADRLNEIPEPDPCKPKQCCESGVCCEEKKPQKCKREHQPPPDSCPPDPCRRPPVHPPSTGGLNNIMHFCLARRLDSLEEPGACPPRQCCNKGGTCNLPQRSTNSNPHEDDETFYPPVAGHLSDGIGGHKIKGFPAIVKEVETCDGQGGRKIRGIVD